MNRAFLVKRIRDGDAAAYDTLVRCSWGALVRYASGIVGSVEGGKDVAQETLLRVWERRADLDPANSIQKYLFRVARNLALDELRKQRVRRRRPETNLVPRSPSTPSEVLEENEVRVAVEQAIDGLSARRREVFQLAYFEGLTHREIAEVMGLAVQTVSNHMTAALSHLLTALRPYLGQTHQPARKAAQKR